MTVKAEFNPSTALMHFTDATKKVQVVVTGGFASNDCCCFLNPDPDIWDSVTTYSEGEEVEFSAIPGFLYVSLVSNNLNNAPPGNPDKWQVSGVQSCGNTEWDSYPPYGGVGKAPAVYEFLITDVPPSNFTNPAYGTTIPSVLEGLHLLEKFILVPNCEYTLIVEDATTTGWFVEIILELNESGLTTEATIGIGADIPLIYRGFTDVCTIDGFIDMSTPGFPDFSYDWNPE